MPKNSESKALIVAICGPTASGKSDLGLALANRLGGTDRAAIVGADAMQLYRGMDIGTAKTPVELRQGILHLQVDQLQVWQEASVAAYQKCARQDVSQLQNSGLQPVIVGGSGLYLRALLDHFEFPPTKSEVRTALEQRVQTCGITHLYEQLTKLDPLAAERIHPHNQRRIIRALEVIELTGRPFSATLPRNEYVQPTVQIGIMLDLEQLDQRILHRTRQMFAQGLVEETRELLTQGLKESKTASRATGYAQAISVIEGKIGRAEAIEAVALATKQLSRRQIKWFRRDSRIHWLQSADLEQAVRILRAQGVDVE